MPLYFTYGSCMNRHDLARSGVSAICLGTAVLKNYRLAFSRYSIYREGGVADIVREPGEYVEGVLYEVSDFRVLDRREGAPYVYRRRLVRVYPEGLGERWRWAWTYEIVDKSPVEFQPSREYAKLIWDGAQVLSREYREKLKQNLLRKDRCRFYAKQELISKVAEKSGLSKKDAAAAVDAVFESISEGLASGDKVSLTGFGAFEVRERAARVGRNPQTGESIEIPTGKVSVFKVGKVLKEVCQA